MVKNSLVVSTMTIFFFLAFGAVLEGMGFDPIYKAHLLKTRVFGVEAVGIWQDDPVLGWMHAPRSTGTQSTLPDYCVSYTIDDEGHRVTSGEYGLPEILLLGGSYTFGHGVEDDETFAHLLQAEWPSFKVVNAGVNAWGTAQAYLKLEQSLRSRENIRLVIYNFIAHHQRRNGLSRAWLESLERTRGRRNPYFVFEAGRLQHRGFADLDDALGPSPALHRSEMRVTIELIVQMKAMAYAAGIPFRVVSLPDGSETNGSAKVVSAIFERRLSENWIDLRGDVDFASLRYEHDFHPTPDGHRYIAERMNDEVLRPVLSR